MIRRRNLLGVVPALAMPLVAYASDYPQMPITLVIPLAPGDAADIAARLMGEALAHLLNVPVVATNRPGAGGTIGTEFVIRAPNDGYTLLFAQNSALTIRRALEPRTTAYDPKKDLTPLGLTTRTPSILVTRKDATFTNFHDMVAQARKAPGKLCIGNAGPGSAGEISVRLVNSLAGTDIVSIPYKGASPAVTDLLGGHVDAVVLALGAVSAHLRSGRFQGLAISSRAPDFADVPTLKQLGYREDLQGVWFAFFVPSGVPRNVADKLIPALEKAARDPRIAAHLQPIGMVQEWTPANRLSDEIDNEYRTVSELFKRAQPRKP